MANAWGFLEWAGFVVGLATLTLPIIFICLVISRIVKAVKKRNDLKFDAALPDGFIQIRRNEIAVHPESGRVLFCPGNKIYDRDQIGSLWFDVDITEYTQSLSGQVKLAGDQEVYWVTDRDDLVVETDDKTWRFNVFNENYSQVYEILRRLRLGTLTRQELKDIGYPA